MNNKQMGDIPTFTPPGAPTFTPPAPTFTPPGAAPGGAVCFHHPNYPAAAKCVRCGKYICKDCVEAYGVTSGKYAGKCLCFDCCQELVAQNVDELTRNKEKIKGQFILQIVGMVIGFIIGVSSGGFLGALLCACIGGVFLRAVKAYFSLLGEAIKIAFNNQFGIVTVLSIIWQCIVIVGKCVYITVSNTIYYIQYLKRTSGLIEQDSAALQQMRDYMEYTLVRSQNQGVDIDSLMNGSSQLQNNSYAQRLRTQGEAAADAALRQATTRIAENGEIIRDFRNAA